MVGGTSKYYHSLWGLGNPPHWRNVLFQLIIRPGGGGGSGETVFCIKTVRIYAKNAKSTPMLLFAGLRNKRQVLLIRIHDLCRLFKSYNKNDFKLGSMAVSNNFNFLSQYYEITKRFSNFLAENLPLVQISPLPNLQPITGAVTAHLYPAF